MEDLSLILWRERELMEMLLYKLEQEQLVLATGRTRWLASAAREVDAVLGMLRQTEVLRAAAADHAAAEVGLLPNPSLSSLAATAPEPWSSILLEHRDAFLAYTRQITEMAAVNRDLLTTGYRSARETLMAMADTTETYAPDGTTVVAEHGRRLVDRSI